MNTELILSAIRKNSEYSALVSSLKTSGKRGRIKPFAVSGIAEGADGFFRTALADDLLRLERNVLLIFPDDREANNMADILADSGVDVMKFPSKDFNFNNMTASHEFENERISVLARLAGLGKRGNFAICTSINAALQVTMPQSVLAEYSKYITAESSIETAELSSFLLRSGYKKVDIVEGAGQFAIRGGIIDLYVPTGNAYRIELFGDEVDRLGTFDPITQRFIDFCDEIFILPSREIVADNAAREKMTSAVKKQLARLTDKKDVLETERVRNLLKRELTEIEELSELNFVDKYLPLIYDNGKTLIDIFDGYVVMTEFSELENRAGAANTLLEQSITDMLEHGEIGAESNLTDGYMKPLANVLYKLESVPSVITNSLSRTLEGLSLGGDFDLRSRHVTPYGSRRELFTEDINGYVGGGYTVAVVCATESERAAITESLVDLGITSANGDKLSMSDVKRGMVLTLCGGIVGGFELPDNRFVLLDYSSDMTGRKRGRAVRKIKKKKSTEAIMSYADLEVGDLVVHAAYGIGQFMGLESLTVAGVTRDYVSIKYSGTDKLFLPADKLDLVSKYIGTGSDTGAVKLSKMGGADWTRAKTKAKTATKEMAKELIALYAARKRAKGFAFSPDDEMCREFADSFEFEETDGQLAAIEEVRRDMEADYPMDRLVCGDVGYGKTEVALRAAMKAVMSGKQVALLVPTTILAYQHFKNFKRRMRSFPVNVDMLSRFRSPSELRASVRKLKRGETDIIIGTHRLISSDVEFYDLGLVIIDEEQRFGVAQKEKLKKIATGADVLTLTATPIPRTLNMAMGGIVDMSLLEEAPGMRAPVQTYVLEYDESIIYEAIRRELRRNGQVFYMYNRVEGIYNVAARLGEAIPDAKIEVAHGKLDKDQLEDIWEALVKGEIDILVCTTIIETGVDIPNANTLIIENADMYGLSQLHQIRGRVGRSGRRAYSYFTYKKNKNLTDVSEKRLAAIKEYAQFGAGFKIALRDLEIRGAGNLLGAEQHGHMEAVGYDLYMKLLNEAVIEEKGEKVEVRPECVIDIQADAYLAKNYIPFAPQRMDLYKKIALISCEEDYEDMIDEICDRFGEPSAPALNLCRIALIKAIAAKSGIEKVLENNGAYQLISGEINPVAISSLATKFPLSKIRVSLGAKPAITGIIPKGARNTDFLLDLVTEYHRMINE